MRELKHQTFLVPRTPTGSIFAAWQPLRMSRRSGVAVTDFKTRVLRLKPKVQILGSSKSIRHTKVAILRLKSCFLRKKETKLHANLWKAFSTELRCRRSWWFDVVLLNDLHFARKPRSRSSSARPAMPFVNQEHLGLVVPTLDSAIHRINLYPADSVIDFCNTYPLDNYLSGELRYPTFEQPGPGA